jgi:hypothetical protein
MRILWQDPFGMSGRKGIVRLSQALACTIKWEREMQKMLAGPFQTGNAHSKR